MTEHDERARLLATDLYSSPPVAQEGMVSVPKSFLQLVARAVEFDASTIEDTELIPLREAFAAIVAAEKEPAK